jgi:preprotein translocase subunit SecB
LGQYVRDLSFEAPGAPSVFNLLRKHQPDIPVSFDCNVRHVSGSTFEVSLGITVEASANNQPVFLIEMIYAALIEVDERVVPEDQLHPLLMIEVPRHLFPFARQVIGDLTVSGGFPPLMLQMVDFVDLYRRKFADRPHTIERKPAA